MTPKIFLSAEEARECCLYWQRQLRLSDWKVKVSIVRRHILPTGRVADCTYHLASKSADVRILDTTDANPETDFVDRDQEIGLVHELLHLHVAPFEPKPETLELTMCEIAIESVAQSIVLINRGIRL